MQEVRFLPVEQGAQPPTLEVREVPTSGKPPRERSLDHARVNQHPGCAHISPEYLTSGNRSMVRGNDDPLSPSSNGRTPGFGPGYRGSSPCGEANLPSTDGRKPPDGTSRGIRGPARVSSFSDSQEAFLSRDYRDRPGGHASGTWYRANGSNWVRYMKTQCRRIARHKAKNDLRNDREPQPRYPIERIYLD